MTCPVCGCFAPPCPETGYNADELCPSCKDVGWIETTVGVIVNEREPDGISEFDQVRR